MGLLFSSIIRLLHFEFFPLLGEQGELVIEVQEIGNANSKLLIGDSRGLRIEIFIVKNLINQNNYKVNKRLALIFVKHLFLLIESRKIIKHNNRVGRIMKYCEIIWNLFEDHSWYISKGNIRYHYSTKITRFWNLSNY